MSFLYPQFLWALSLALVPVIIHLLNLRKTKQVYFSNTFLLEKVDEQRRKRTRLRDILVLLLRILAITMLVLAFAQPVRVKNNILPCKQGVSIYVDNSFSMNSRGLQGIDLEVAKNWAYKIIHSFPPGTRFMVLTGDFSPKEQRFYNSQLISDFVPHIQTSYYRPKLSKVVEKFKNLLKSKDSNCTSLVFYISDFQKNVTDFASAQIPKNWKMFFIPVQPVVEKNIAIDTIYFASPYHILGHDDQLIVKIRNYSNQDLSDVPVKVFIQDSLKAISNISIPANSTVTIKFEYTNTHPGWTKGRVWVEDNPVVFDNTMYFSYFTRYKYKILLVSDKENKYLKALYSIGPFELNWVTEDRIPYSSLAEYDAIVLDGLDVYTTGLQQQLNQYLRSGGVVVIIPHENYSSVNQLLQGFGLAPFASADTNLSHIGWINIHNYLYKNVILSYQVNNLLPKVRRYFVRKVSFSVETPLLQLRNGVYVLTQSDRYNGKVYVFSFSLDSTATDFVFSKLFIATMYNIPLFAGYNFRSYYTLGRDRYVVLINTHNAEYFTVKSKNLEFIPPHRSVGNKQVLDLGYSPGLKAGVYEVFARDSLIGYVAMNYNRQESDLSYFKPQQIRQILRKLGVRNVQVLPGSVLVSQARIVNSVSGRQLWKIFLIIGLILLLTEELINRLLK